MTQRSIAQENKFKRYVSVIVCYPVGQDRSHAQLIRLQFQDGSVWVVDKCSRGFWAAAQKAGGRGMLYPVLATPLPSMDSSAMPGQCDLKVFNDDEEWFVELDEPEQEGDA